MWCGYAWPVEYEETGRRTFLITWTGDILTTGSSRYPGTDAPHSGAAFEKGSKIGITGAADPKAKANDGNLRKFVN